MGTNLYNVIKSQINSKHYSLEYIASQMGFSRSWLSRMIRNPDISVQSLKKLSEILNYNFFNHLYSGPGQATPEQYNELFVKSNKLERELRRANRELQILRQTNEILTAQLTQLSKANINPKPPEPPTE